MSSLVIWKFPIPLDGLGSFVLDLPSDRQFLAVQLQFARPQMWFLVKPDSPKASVRFRVIGTGEPIEPTPSTFEYRGTFQLHGGELVLHVFEEMPV